MNQVENGVRVGQLIGACILAAFGGAWAVAAALLYPGRAAPAAAAVLGLTAIVVLASAIRSVVAVRRESSRSPTRDGASAARARTVARSVGIISTIQGIAIALASTAEARAGRVDLIVPTVAAIVGLHFFALVPTLRIRSDAIWGAILVFAGIAGVWARGREAASFAVALVAAIVLWIAALDRMRRARA